MTTHELARLLENLRDGLGNALNSAAGKDFSAVAESFRSLPDKTLKELVKDLKSLTERAKGGAATIIQRINAIQSGGGEAVEAVMAAVSKLKLSDLKEVLKAFGIQAKRTLVENKKLISGLLEQRSGREGHSVGQPAGNQSVAEVEEGYREFCALRDAAQGLGIADLRAGFEALRRFSKPVLEGISQRLGYQFDGSKDDILGKLLQTLEGMRISQVRGEAIGSS